jgi:glycosyltransferase involved in cell wall biosynthesis
MAEPLVATAGPAADGAGRRPRPAAGGSSERAVVCFPFVGQTVGGAHISALHLISHLDRTRFEPLVLLHQPRGPLAELLAGHGIAAEPAPRPEFMAGGNPLRDAAVFCRGTFELARLLRRRAVRIVHTNDGAMHSTWAVPARLAGARLLWHHRGNPGARGVRYVAPVLADHIVCVSAFATPGGAWWRRRGQCSVVHSPFDTTSQPPDRTVCRQALLDELGLPPTTAVLGFFGNLVPRKRPDLFVAAAAALRRLAPDLEFIAPLFGEDRGGFGAIVGQRAQALGIIERTPLMGFRYPPEGWLGACDLLLVPAVDEPFGRTLIEAMLLGTPVVAADAGGNPEAIRHGETGYLVPPDDPDALARQALAALRDPTGRAAMAARARADAVARFGFRRHAEALMQIYDRILHPRQPSPADLVAPRA